MRQSVISAAPLSPGGSGAGRRPNLSLIYIFASEVAVLKTFCVVPCSTTCDPPSRLSSWVIHPYTIHFTHTQGQRRLRKCIPNFHRPRLRCTSTASHYTTQRFHLSPAGLTGGLHRTYGSLSRAPTALTRGEGSGIEPGTSGLKSARDVTRPLHPPVKSGLLEENPTHSRT